MTRILYYLKEMLVVAIPAAIVFCGFWPYRRRALAGMGLRTKVWREIGLILFVMALFGVLAVTIWPIYIGEPNSGNTGNIILLVDRPNPLYNVNLIPLRMFLDYTKALRSGDSFFRCIEFPGESSGVCPIRLFPRAVVPRPKLAQVRSGGLWNLSAGGVWAVSGGTHNRY